MKLKDQISYVEHHANVEVLSMSKAQARHLFEGSDGKVYVIKSVAGIESFDSSLDAFEAIRNHPGAYVVNAKQSELLARNSEKAIHARGY